jgi:hypothetical protein
MADRPTRGDVIEHPFLGGDVRIEVSQVPEGQPLVDTDGIHIIIDQYGEQHLVEQDGDTWVVGSEDSLSEEGFDRWVEFQNGASMRASL